MSFPVARLWKYFFFVLSLIGALLHAYWNFILKSAADKAVAVMSIFFTSLPFALFGLVFSGMPKFEFLPFILLSAILQNIIISHFLKHMKSVN